MPPLDRAGRLRYSALHQNKLIQREDLCTCEVEEILGLARSRASYRLRVLVDAGILARESRGTWSHYRLRDRRLLDRFRGLAAPASKKVHKRKA